MDTNPLSHSLFTARLSASCRAAGPRPRRFSFLLGLLGWSLVFLACLEPASAAPYPREGRTTQWVQPDGQTLALRVFGDEFYGRTTTSEGFTVVFVPEAKAYYYAERGSDGNALVSSRILATQAPPARLPKHLRESEARVRAIREANIRTYAPDRAARWAARVQAVRKRRAAPADLAPKTAEAAAAPANADEASGAPVSGSKIGLMILAQFPNDNDTLAFDPVNFPVPQAKMNRFANTPGYSDDGNSGSVRDYFFDQSNRALTHTQTVTTIVTLPHPRNYYNYSDYPANTTLANSGTAGRLLVADAVAKLQTINFNFSSASVDGNNRVLATSVLYAGEDSGVFSRGLWPHAFTLAGSGINVGTTSNPRFISAYQCTNVPTAAPVIGTVCHELGHLLLGYPDLYDPEGDSEGIGAHCLMASGGQLNGGKTPAPINLYLKDFSGWSTITDLTPGQLSTAVLFTTGNRGHRVRNPARSAEYFLVENRGTGDKWANFCRDTGVMIWHVDEDVTTANRRQQMTSSQHYEVSLEQADGDFDMENNTNRGDSDDLFDLTSNEFNGNTTPNSDWWSGDPSNIAISVLSNPASTVTVRFSATATSTLGVTPPTQSVTADGGTQSFTVVSNMAWSWSDNASWVTSSEATSQTGNQTFTYTVAANSASTSRTAVITITGGGLTRTHTVSQSAVIIDDHGGSTASATSIGLNSTTSGNIETAGDSDFFRITVDLFGTLVIESSGSGDTFGALLDSGGAVIAQDDNSGATSNFRITREVTRGTYYLRVTHASGTSTGTYQVVSSFTEPVDGLIVGELAVGTTSIEINFTGMAPGVIYTILRSFDLRTWTTEGQITGASPATVFSQTKPPGQTSVYYRVTR